MVTYTAQVSSVCPKLDVNVDASVILMLGIADGDLGADASIDDIR